MPFNAALFSIFSSLLFLHITVLNNQKGYGYYLVSLMLCSCDGKKNTYSAFHVLFDENCPHDWFSFYMHDSQFHYSTSTLLSLWQVFWKDVRCSHCQTTWITWEKRLICLKAYLIYPLNLSVSQKILPPPQIILCSLEHYVAYLIIISTLGMQD